MWWYHYLARFPPHPIFIPLYFFDFIFLFLSLFHTQRGSQLHWTFLNLPGWSYASTSTQSTLFFLKLNLSKENHIRIIFWYVLYKRKSENIQEIFCSLNQWGLINFRYITSWILKWQKIISYKKLQSFLKDNYISL